MECEVMCHLNKMHCEACVQIVRKGQVSFQALPEMPAWLCEYAMPLDQFLQEPAALPERCVVSDLLAILRTAEVQVIVSDLGFYNFGVIRDQVCIIDTGSRSLEHRCVTKELSSCFLEKISQRAKEVCVSEYDQMVVSKHLDMYRSSQDIKLAISNLEKEWIRRPTCGECEHASPDENGEKVRDVNPEVRTTDF